MLRVESGENPETVIAALGFHRSCIYTWLAKYREGGLEALAAKPVPGRPPRLQGGQLRELYRIITGQSPLQLHFEFALWTRAMIREVIWERFGVRLSEVSVGRLLRKLGLTPQKPLYRAYQQDQAAVARWLAEEYPAIQRHAKQEGAIIYFGDEAGVRSDFHRGTTWAAKGRTPVVETTGERFSLNLISAISPRGELRFMTVEGRVGSDQFLEFLERLLHNSERPIFLIVDNHPIHRARKVIEFVQASQGKLRLYYLPPYSPALNPDESVWRHVKTHNVGRARLSSREDLKDRLINCLHRLQQNTWLLKAFFHTPQLAYAAE